MPSNDPLTRCLNPLYWARVGIDGDVVTMARGHFARLREYSCSVPTGGRVGETWRRREPFGAPDQEAMWWLGEYVEDPDPGYIRIKWRRIVVLEEEPWRGYE